MFLGAFIWNVANTMTNKSTNQVLFKTDVLHVFLIVLLKVNENNQTKNIFMVRFQFNYC